MTLFGVLGCGGSAPGSGTAAKVDGAPATGCDTDAAQISVGSAALTIDCGCDEAAGTQAVKPNALTCTVANGTTVVFNYAEHTLPRQILSKGTPSFVSSPPSDPSEDEPLQAHAVKFEQIGTYQYEDGFDSTLHGKIIVR